MPEAAVAETELNDLTAEDGRTPPAAQFLKCSVGVRPRQLTVGPVLPASALPAPLHITITPLSASKYRRLQIRISKWDVEEEACWLRATGHGPKYD